MDIMGFNDKYSTDLRIILSIRKILCFTLFRTSHFQEAFIRALEENIDCMGGILFDPNTLTYTVKVKKTSIKKIPNFRAEATFYYKIIGDILSKVLPMYKEEMVNIFNQYPIAGIFGDDTNPLINAYHTYDMLMGNPYYIYNLSSIQCISDNMIQIIM